MEYQLPMAATRPPPDRIIHPVPPSGAMEKTLTFQIGPEDHGERLDRRLAALWPDLSRARIKSLIEEGYCTVEGRRPKVGQKVQAGQLVVLTIPPTAPTDLFPDPEVVFSIIYQDADLIAIDKPPGLVVHPAVGHGTGTLVHGLLAACPDLTGIGGETRPGIVHRLDKDTSGVMVAAKNEKAHRALVEAFKERGVGKTYLAICRGRRPSPKGEVDLPIGRHPVHRKEMSTRSRAGRSALTRYELLRWYKEGVGFLKVQIFTGRTHQIRVHLAAIGCPVLGDPVYGKGAAGRLKGLAARQMLHSQRLTLDHPTSGERMIFEAPLPEDMARVLDALKEKTAAG
jgi:23S rRNA pseudouridine1911/1915/1917 synthase